MQRNATQRDWHSARGACVRIVQETRDSKVVLASFAWRAGAGAAVWVWVWVCRCGLVCVWVCDIHVTPIKLCQSHGAHDTRTHACTQSLPPTCTAFSYSRRSFAGTAPPILDRSQISAGDQKHDIEAFVRGPLCTALSRFFVLGFKSNSLFKVHPRCHICTGTELAPATSAPGLGSPVPTSAPGLGSSEWHALPRG